MKIRFLLLSICCLLGVFAAKAQNSGPAGDNVTWTYNNGTLTISGTGSMTNYGYDSNVAPWRTHHKAEITKVQVDAGVSSIGAYAFAYLSEVTQVSLPNALGTIGESAFSNCAKLTSIDIPTSVSSIGGSAFSRSGLTSIIWPESVSDVPANAFSTCSSLTTVTLPSTITMIGNYAFNGCAALQEFNISATTAPNILSSTIFDGSSIATATLNVPAGSLDSYQANSKWNQFGTKNEGSIFITSRTPGIEASDIIIDAVVSVTFSEDVTGENLILITIEDTNGTDVANVSGTLSGKVLTISHDDFEYGTTYTVKIPDGSITEYDKDITWSFTTEADPNSPSITITSPADKAEVTTNEVELTFTVSNFDLETDGSVVYKIGDGVYQEVTPLNSSENNYTVKISGLTQGDNVISLGLKATGIDDPDTTAEITIVYSPGSTDPDNPSTGEYHTIAIEVAPGIDLYNQTVGNIVVEEGSYLQLQFLPEDPAAQADNILFLIDGVETAFQNFGGNYYFSYILNQINQDHSILIAMKNYTVTLPEVGGVTIDIGSGNHTIGYGEKFTFSLTLADDIDPANVHVFANGTEITPEPTRSVTLTYIINKVTGPIDVSIEGAGDPVGNISMDASLRVYPANSSLIIETATPQAVQVYTLTGVLVANRHISGYEAISLSSGIYIVRAGTAVFKVLVKD